MYVYMYVCMKEYMYVCMYEKNNVCMHVCMYICVPFAPMVTPRRLAGKAALNLKEDPSLLETYTGP